MRAAVILLQLACLAAQPLWAGEPPVPPAAIVAGATVSDAELAAIDRVVETLIAAGAPETRGASLVVGKVVVSEVAEKGKESQVGVEDNHDFDPFGSPNEETSPEGLKSRTWSGVHMVLADGRWLMQMRTLVAPSAQRTITPAADCTRLAPAQLAEHLAKNADGEDFAPWQDEDDSRLDLFTPEARTRMTAVAKAAKPLMSLGRWIGDIGMLLLHRAGTTGASAQLLLEGMNQLYPWYAGQDEPAPLILDPVSSPCFPWSWDAKPKDWREEKKGTLSIPDPTPVLNRDIVAWFHGLLANERQRTAYGLSLEHVCQQIIAFTPAERRAQAKADLDLLLAARALPVKAAADADLAARLQSWQISAWRPSEADVPGLLDLLTDPRPSRWIDGTIAHPLGDTALYALHAVMRVDPRLLAGRNPAKPWTAAERSASAEAIRAWHQGLGGKPLGEGLLAAIEHLPLGGAITLIANRKPDERAPLFQRLAAVLPATPDKDLTASLLGRLLAIAGEDPAITAKVSAWPATGPLRPLLAVWHNQQGRPAELDKLLDDLVPLGNADDQASRRLTMALQAAMSRPSVSRMQRFLTLAAGPLSDRRTWAVLAAVGEEHGWWDQEWGAVMMFQQQSERQGHFSNQEEDKADPANAIPLAIFCTYLADRRVLGEKDATLKMRGQWGQLKLPGLDLGVKLPKPAGSAEAGKAVPVQKSAKQPVAPPPLPTGLRVSDIAAMLSPRLLYRGGLHELVSNEVTLWSEPAARDAAQHTLAVALAEKARAALAAAKLPPDLLPATTPANHQGLF